MNFSIKDFFSKCDQIRSFLFCASKVFWKKFVANSQRKTFMFGSSSFKTVTSWALVPLLRLAPQIWFLGYFERRSFNLTADSTIEKYLFRDVLQHTWSASCKHATLFKNDFTASVSTAKFEMFFKRTSCLFNVQKKNKKNREAVVPWCSTK